MKEKGEKIGRGKEQLRTSKKITIKESENTQRKDERKRGKDGKR